MRLLPRVIQVGSEAASVEVQMVHHRLVVALLVLFCTPHTCSANSATPPVHPQYSMQWEWEGRARCEPWPHTARSDGDLQHTQRTRHGEMSARTECGEWRVASGEWRVASGEWRVAWRVASAWWRVRGLCEPRMATAARWTASKKAHIAEEDPTWPTYREHTPQ
jgi:hypothetical protein